MRNLIAAVAFTAIYPSSEAHHEIATDVDLTNYVDLTGTIDLVEWINPHVVIHLSTEDSNGRNRIWLIQADTPNTLLRQGINRSSISYMNSAQIRVYPSESSTCAIECYGYGYQFSAANGRTYILNREMYELVNQISLQ